MPKIEESLPVKDLLTRVQERHDEKLKEAEKLKEEARQKIAEAMKEEERLKQKIKVSRTQIEKIELEYDTLFEKEVQRSLEEIEKQSVSKKNVKSGVASLSQFQAQGREDTEIKEIAQNQAMEEMEKISDIIREMKKQILKDEFDMCDIRLRIYSLSTRPATIMQETYKSCLDWLQYEFDMIQKDGSQEIYLKRRKKHELNLATSGISVDGGFVWRGLIVKQARKIIHDPILPKEHIPLLLEQLNNVENESAKVTITLHSINHPFPGPPVTVRLER